VGRDRPDPEELSPAEAAERYLARRRPDSTDRSIEGWRGRLRRFEEWCDEVGIDAVGELQRYDIDEYYEYRSAQVAPVTLEGEMWTFKMFLGFLEDIGAIEEGLADAVRIPDLDPSERSSDVQLHADAALPILEYYRSTDAMYGTRQHAFFEVLWTTGARQGGLRALDLRDVHLFDDSGPYIEFRHRPGTGTPLKNKVRGERPVALSATVADVLREYVSSYRLDKRDEIGRQPFFATRQGRASPVALRTWSYLSTIPCQHSACPHGKDPETCEWTSYHHASKCPSSRSPHQVRTGVITWMLNQGWPPEDVASRVNSSVETIEQHYDKADLDERRSRLRDRMEQRRRPLVDQLDPNPDNHDNT
jgi:site-specific recombinase XerD